MDGIPFDEIVEALQSHDGSYEHEASHSVEASGEIGASSVGNPVEAAAPAPAPAVITIPPSKPAKHKGLCAHRNGTASSRLHVRASFAILVCDDRSAARSARRQASAHAGRGIQGKATKPCVSHVRTRVRDDVPRNSLQILSPFLGPQAGRDASGIWASAVIF